MLLFIKVLVWALFYLSLTGFLAALFSYPVFVLEGSGDVSFLRSLVSRIGQGFLLIGLYPLARCLSMRLKDVLFQWRELRTIPKGFFIGVLLLSLHVVFLALTQIRIFVPPSVAHGVALFNLLIKSLGIGFGVAMLEEITFRGAVLGVFLKTLPRYLALSTSALFFAALHFVGSKWSGARDEIGFDAPFKIAIDGFANVIHAPFDALLALFIAGLFLAIIRVSVQGGLGLCIGIHAGWVFVIRLTKTWTYPNLKSEGSYWISSYDYVIGYFSSLWLGVLVIGLWLLLKISKNRGGPLKLEVETP